MKAIIIDNGGRRSGMDRRVFLYAAYLPERRSGQVRRNGVDRRKVADRRSVKRSTRDRRA